MSLVYVEHSNLHVERTFKKHFEDFPGDPVVNIPHFQHRGTGSIPGWRTKIPHAAQCGQKR